MEIIDEAKKTTIHYDLGAVIQGEGVVSNLAYHRDGKWMVISDSAGSVHLVDALSGVEKKKVYAKTNGIGQVQYTHHEACILLSHENNASDIQYLSLYDNRYLRNFSGHTDHITSLSMSPIDDCFLSACMDKSVRLWDMRASGPALGKLSLPSTHSRATVNFDESGLVFGVMSQDMRSKRHYIKLYDYRNYSAGPFENIVPAGNLLEASMMKSNHSLHSSQIKQSLHAPWSSFEFTTDGNNLLVNSQSDFVYILDGFRPDVEPVSLYRKNDAGQALGACFSPTGSFVAASNDENEVILFDPVTGEQKDVLVGHVSPVGCIRHNPRYEQLASGCVNAVLWILKNQMGPVV